MEFEIEIPKQTEVMFLKLSTKGRTNQVNPVYPPTNLVGSGEQLSTTVCLYHGIYLDIHGTYFYEIRRIFWKATSPWFIWHVLPVVGRCIRRVSEVKFQGISNPTCNSNLICLLWNFQSCNILQSPFSKAVPRIKLLDSPIHQNVFVRSTKW